MFASSTDELYRDFIALSRYARWIEKDNRRETWDETVDRYVDYMVNRIERDREIKIDRALVSEIRAMIFSREVMPSMRGLMIAGPALDRDDVGLYNCSFIPADNVRAFDEAMYILMCGTGVGFSVESQYVEKLPVVNEHFEYSSTVVTVDDSKAGWARAFRELLALLYQGQIPKFDITRVRPAGARLKTFGGRASGPQPLVDLFDFTVKMFRNAAGRKLTSLEAHDLFCKIGEVVVVGGVRRSAMISLSDLGDDDMSKAKAGAWYETKGHRRLSNNSAVYDVKPSISQFLGEWKDIYDSKSGERGIFNREGNRRHASENGRRDGSRVAGTNPCGEILLRPNQFCNLTEVVVRDYDTADSLARKVEIATILGTWQASMTNFKYIRKIWRDNCEEERLLGVSFTGQFGNARMSGKEGLDVLASDLQMFRNKAVETNREWAGLLGINESTAITTVKPSGTVSQLVGASSGMHPWHAPFYARTVRADNKDPMTEFLKDSGVYWEPDLMAKDSTTVFYFPVKAPENAVFKRELTAIEHLEIWKVYRENWTEHNPSVTISIKDEEWVEVAAWVYDNWDSVGGISFLPYSDHVYKQAPYTDMTAEEFAELVEKTPTEINWSALAFYEFEDTTTGAQALSCTSGECELVDLTK